MIKYTIIFIQLLVLSHCASLTDIITDNYSRRKNQAVFIYDQDYRLVKLNIQMAEDLRTVTTPAILRVNPAKTKHIILHTIDECYDRKSYQLTRTLDSAYYFNFTPFTFPGLLIDYYSGSMWRMDDRIILKNKPDSKCGAEKLRMVNQNIFRFDQEPPQARWRIILGSTLVMLGGAFLIPALGGECFADNCQQQLQLIGAFSSVAIGTGFYLSISGSNRLRTHRIWEKEQINLIESHGNSRSQRKIHLGYHIPFN